MEALRMPRSLCSLRFLLTWVGMACGLAMGGSQAWSVQNPESRTAPDDFILVWKSQGSMPSEPGETITLALPGAAVPAWSWIRVDTAATFTLKSRADAGQEPNCQPQWGQPLRYRDLHLITLTWTPCMESGDRIFAVSRVEIAIHPSRNQAETKVFAGAWDSPQEKALRNWLVNYEQSRNFRTQAPTALGKMSASGYWGAQIAAQRLTLFTREDGIHVLDYEGLKNAGLPTRDIATKSLRLWHAGREVPFYLSGDLNGRLDPGDEIEFLGQASTGSSSFFSPYSGENAFYLTWDGLGLGLRAPLFPAPDLKAAASTSPVYQAKWHAEKDRVILRAFSTAEENITDLGARVQEQALSEFWYWERLGPEKDLLTLNFDLPFTPANSDANAGPGLEAKIRVQLKGITDDLKADPDHHLRFLLNGRDISLSQGRSYDAVWEGQASYTWTSPPIPIGFLKAGENELGIQKVGDLKTSDGKVVEIQDAYLNWIEVDLPAKFSAVKGRIRFGNDFKDSLGLRRFQVEGFATDSQSLWDMRGRKIAGFSTYKQAGGYALRFSDSLVAATAYLAVDRDQRLKPRLVLDTLPDLLHPSRGADWICITDSRLFGKSLDSLVNWRKAQGLRTAVVQAKHIYQTFGDGVVDPMAIRKFLQYAYENWPRPAPTYLLLLGETSLWFDKLDDPAQPNLVPTHLIDIRGWGVAANDDFFGKVAGEDDIPDLFVGRIPVANTPALSHVVAKMMRQEKERDQGAWANQVLLISGYEKDFAAATDGFQRQALGQARHTGRIDLFPESRYYRPPEKRRDFFKRLDSGLAMVQFFGHGGGSVWSDAGILTLQALDKDSLKGDWALPFVSSLTCLTGYFEDPYERSLGEELLRRPRNGAAAFYGASGYISSAAGKLLGDELLSVSLRGGKTTVGAMIQEAETRVRQKSGDAFLPILAEFNLLGDPAMTFGFPIVREELSVSPRLGSATQQIELSGKTDKITSGEVKIQISSEDSVLIAASDRLDGKAYQHTVSLNAPPSARQGHASVHFFRDTLSEVLSGRFTGLDWMIDSLAMEPREAGYGDSVTVHLTLSSILDSLVLESGIALFALGGDDVPAFQNADQRLLTSGDGRHFTTALPFEIPTPALGGNPWPKLYVQFRLGLKSGNPQGSGVIEINETTPHVFALQPRPRIGLGPKPFHLPWQDSLGLWVRFQNSGPGPAEKFRARLTYRLLGETESVEKEYAGKLPYAQGDSLWLALPDMALLSPIKADLIPRNPADGSPTAMSADTNFQLLTARLGEASDTLVLDSAGILLIRNPAAVQSQRKDRVFVRISDLPSLPSHLRIPDGDSSGSRQGYHIVSLARDNFPFLKRSAALGKTASTDKASLLAHTGWHLLADGNREWNRLDTAQNPEPQSVAEIRVPGIYAYLTNTDVTPPVISFQSRGQTLWPDDYIPQRTPIDIVLQDGVGLDLIHSPPVLRSRGMLVDSSHLSMDKATGSPTLARLRFIPDFNSGADTLEISAYDLSGNRLEKKFPYRLGNALAVHNLGSYPNPFADTAIFAYTLTDYCDKVTLTVYSRSGRRVRRLTDNGSVGYREVVWDGRTDQGQRIANGLYYLQVTAKTGDKSSTSIFKLFKKRRF